MLGSDGHFLPLADAFEKPTSEKCRPSFHSKNKKATVTALLQHERNANLLLQCDECSKWRLVYALRKLPANQRNQLMKALDGIAADRTTYTG
jgi:hypothetical protein